jgi:carbon-monoxide dehydrogenase medium subunit
LDSSQKRIQEAKIALGPVAEKPFRPRRLKLICNRRRLHPKPFSGAARIASEEANPRTSLLRGSDAYRREMIRLYLERTLQGLLESYKNAWQI